MKKPVVTNVLAERYASAALCEIWSPEGKIRLERDFWIAVMKGQRDLGLDIPAEAIAAYEAARDDIDLADIAAREAVSRHDVKARIESYNAAAGFEHIHKGMTSRDLTENVEQLQVLRSLQLLLPKAVAVAGGIADRAQQDRDLTLAARTHNVAAQPTTVGKRWAMFGEELVQALPRLASLIERYPVRGLKGAVGTQLDQFTLFAGNLEAVQQLEERVVEHLGFGQALGAVGQVYPRSLDFDVVSCLCQLGAGPSSFARTLRLMAGHELAGEGFAKGQTGSSAMPHKMNARSCERINGFHTLLKGYVTMAGGLAGDQWNEGDVSCSVVRRVVLGDAFFAIDGLLETTMVVLGQMDVFPDVVNAELDRYLPFLATTTVLMEAVAAGAGREAAHHAIKEHAVAVLGDLRSGAVTGNDLFERLAADERIPLPPESLSEILERARTLTGRAGAQVDDFVERVSTWQEKVPESRSVAAGEIL